MSNQYQLHGDVLTRKFPSVQTPLKLQPQQITQKWALGTWCSWQTFSFVALPSMYKISSSFGCISHALSRGVKGYIKSSTYISLDSCSKVMEQSEMEEKMQQGAHACTAVSPGKYLRSQRGRKVLMHHLHQTFPSKWLHLHLRLGPWHFNGPLSPVFMNT